MADITYLNNQFLIAMPNLADPHFFHTVTYVCQHNDEGALGIVINRPTEMKLGDILEQMLIRTSLQHVKDVPIFAGGPVQRERGFVLHSNSERYWDASIPVSERTSLTSSRDILEAIALGEGPRQFIIALGYAGWGKDQLEKEMLDNAWLTAPYSDSILFDTPVSERWQAAASQLGVNIHLLSGVAGHS